MKSEKQFSALMQVLSSEQQIIQRTDQKAFTLLSILGVFMVFFIVHFPKIQMTAIIFFLMISYFTTALGTIFYLVRVIVPRVRKHKVKTLDDDVEKDVNWMNFRQHFFSSMLLTDTEFPEVAFSSEDLVKDEEVDTVYTKKYGAKMLLEPQAGALSYNMNMYYGPTDYQIFKGYDRNLDEAMPLGWGIFGMINKYLIIPVFGVLSNWFPAGIAIIVLTILFKLLLSPVQYKQYVSQAKMKVLKPEMDEIKKKYEGNQMKIQQETMKLQSATGASPLKGCLPALLQIPVFFALYKVLMLTIEMRHQPFILWIKDLSAPDPLTPVNLFGLIPFDPPGFLHIGVVPILLGISMFFQFRLNPAPMDDTQKQIFGLMPWVMMFIMAPFAVGLQIYWITSNVLTIAQQQFLYSRHPALKKKADAGTGG